MARLTTRLDRIEDAAGVEWTDIQLEQLRWYALPSCHEAVLGHAEIIAQRRWLHGHGKTGGRPMKGGGWYSTVGDGWHWHTKEHEREPLIAEELRALALLFGVLPLRAALETWADEPDERDWPALSYTDMGSRLLFWRMDEWRRDRHRDFTGSDKYGVALRQLIPDWRPDLTSDEYDVIEARLMAAIGGFESCHV